MLGEDGINDGALGQGFTGFGWVLPVGLVVVDVKLQDIAIIDSIADGVFVQRLLKQALRSLQRLSSPLICVMLALASKMGVPVKPKSWALGKNVLMAWWFSPN